MIAIILRQPNGDGTWSDRIGLTTGDSAVTVAGFPCLPGWIGDGDVSEWSHRLNISQARGGVPEAITWGFGLIDWDGSVRRSVGILDGQAQMVGWAVAMYVSTDGVTWSDAILGSVHFRIKSAPVNGRRIAVECVEAWGMDSHAVGESAGGLQVGAVAGGMPVTVEVPEIADPVALEYLRPAGMCDSPSTRWKAGVPGAQIPAGETTDRATSWDGSRLVFLCVDNAEAQTLAARMTALLASGNLLVIGARFAEVPQDVAVSGDSVRLKMTAGFAAKETSADKVAAVDSSLAAVPIAYGGASVVGWDVDGRQANAQGESTVSGGVLYFAPTIPASGGFISYTRIPCSVRFDVNSSTPRAWAPYFGLEYTGNVEAVDTSGNVGNYTAYDPSTLEPTGTTGTVQAWGESQGPDALYLRLSVENQDSLSYDWLAVDVAAVIHAKNDPEVSMPFCTDSTADLPVSFSAGVYTYQLSANGPELIRPSQTFANFAALADATPISVNHPNSAVYNYEVLSLQLYGAKIISPSGASAVVQPGASRWWSSPEIPSKAADLLLSDLEDSGWVASSPSYEPSASRWGLAFDADRRVIDAAADIASEFWTVLGEGSNDVQSGADGEIPGPPSFTLGDPVDIVTEPVIEYDYWAGSYRKRAYIAHVDEPYNSEDSQRYFAGWDEDGASTSYGLQIWMACRAAWLHHGRRKSVVYQSPGVRDAGILGWMWCATRNGRSRAEWLSLQTRYMTFSIRETVPSWWAGNVVRIPQTMATWAGYDLSALTSESLVVTEKRWNPLDMVTTFEVALPPVVPSASGDVIVQQLGAGYDLIQQTLNAGDDLLSQVVQ